MTLGKRNRSIVSLIAVILILSVAPMVGFFGALDQSISQADESETRGATAAIDTRPDPSITSSDMYVLRNGVNVTSATFGYLVTIHAIVYNLGISNATDLSIRLGIRSANASYIQYNYTIFEGSRNISSNALENFVDFNYTWRIQITGWYPYEIWALLDPEGQMDEQNETNNLAVIPFTIDPLSIDMTITTDKTQYEPGDALIFTATITYYGTLTPVPYLPGLEFFLVDTVTSSEIPDTRTQIQAASDHGIVVGMLVLPADLASDQYQVLAEFMGMWYSGNIPSVIDVKGQAEPLDPLLIAAIVIAIIVGIVAVAAYVMRRWPKV